MKAALDRARDNIKGRLDGHYQHEGVRWMLYRELYPKEAKGGILADDMGLGKTMQAIATMRGNQVPTLIITIVSTVGQWRDALIEFGGYRPIIINPSFTGMLPMDIDVAITTYSCFQKAKGAAESFASMTWGRIILDEGHSIRNSATKVYQGISQLKTDIKWILSGTPIQNSEKDMLTLARWIGYPSADVEDIVDNIVLRRTQEQQAIANPRLALPPIDTKIMRLKFDTPKEEAFYHRVETEFMESRGKHKNDAMEGIMRCRQACTHPQLYIEGIGKKKKRKRGGHMISENDETPSTSSKFNYLVNDIVSTKEKILIFCTWTTEMKLLQAALKERNVSSLIYDGKLTRDNKEAVIYNFKNTTIQVLILQINCGSTGLNLQCATRVYITSPHWNPCVELQAIGRAYRKGQTQKVTCIRLTMADTIEDKCATMQMEKINLICDAMSDESITHRLGSGDRRNASLASLDEQSSSFTIQESSVVSPGLQAAPIGLPCLPIGPLSPPIGGPPNSPPQTPTIPTLFEKENGGDDIILPELPHDFSKGFPDGFFDFSDMPCPPCLPEPDTSFGKTVLDFDGEFDILSILAKLLDC